jgi:hypothetical protein
MNRRRKKTVMAPSSSRISSNASIRDREFDITTNRKGGFPQCSKGNIEAMTNM